MTATNQLTTHLDLFMRLNAAKIPVVANGRTLYALTLGERFAQHIDGQQKILEIQMTGFYAVVRAESPQRGHWFEVFDAFGFDDSLKLLSDLERSHKQAVFARLKRIETDFPNAASDGMIRRLHIAENGDVSALWTGMIAVLGKQFLPFVQ
jgi:hypothetical protein